MPSRASRLTDLSHPDAVKIINDLLNQLSDRVDDVAKAAKTKRIASTSVLNFGTIAANSCVDSTVNIQGANTNLVAHANPILPLGSTNLSWSAYVSTANQVKVRVCNPTTSPIAVNTVRWNILVS